MYTVSNPPQSFPDVYEELRKIQEALNGPVDFLRLNTLYAAPAKPREGDIAKAAGAPHWNPGAGAGTYQYRGGAWVFLG